MYYNQNMKNIAFFTIYIVFFAVLSSILFSVLYMQFDEQPMFALNKAIKYGAILLCIIFIFPTLKLKRLYNRSLIGFTEPKKEFILNTFKGFFISIILSIPLIFLFLFLDMRNLNNTQIFFDGFLTTIIFTILISYLISFIEESFFRGILIQKNKSILQTTYIILFSGAVYSLFHFIKIPLILDEEIFWNTGLIEIFNVFSNFYNLVSIDAAITLLVFGTLLGFIRIKTMSISYCIGIHAGFVFVIKVFRQNTNVNFDSEYNSLLSSYDHFTGHLSTLWIILVLTFYLIFIKNKDKP